MSRKALSELPTFRSWLSQPKIVDVAMALAISAVFTSFVTKVVNELIMPVVSLPFKKPVEDMFLVIRPGRSSKREYTTITDARYDGASVIGWGALVGGTAILLFQALVVYLIVVVTGRIGIDKDIPEVICTTRRAVQARARGS